MRSRTRRALFGAAALVLAAGLACFLAAREPAQSAITTVPIPTRDDGSAARSSKSRLPGPRAPAAMRSDVPRAEAGPVFDRLAAATAFSGAQRCLALSGQLGSWQSIIDRCEGSETQPQIREQCARNVAKAQREMEVALTAFASCSADIESLEADNYETMTAAARLGDTHAQLCWVEGFWHHDITGEAYQADALAYLHEALARGDWRFVALMARTYVDNPPRSAALLVYGEPPAGRSVDFSDFVAAPYRMNRLLRLGATGKYAQWLDLRKESSAMSPEQIAAANAWAEREYEDHFASHPQLEEVPDSCQTGSFDDTSGWAKHPWQTTPPAAH